jgi:hypothetical protein
MSQIEYQLLPGFFRGLKAQCLGAFGQKELQFPFVPSILKH